MTKELVEKTLNNSLALVRKEELAYIENGGDNQDYLTGYTQVKMIIQGMALNIAHIKDKDDKWVYRQLVKTIIYFSQEVKEEEQVKALTHMKTLFNELLEEKPVSEKHEIEPVQQELKLETKPKVTNKRVVKPKPIPKPAISKVPETKESKTKPVESIKETKWDKYFAEMIWGQD